MQTPLAYFLTFTCYGTWLHGDERGSVDREHNLAGTPVLEPDASRRSQEQECLTESPYQLDAERRGIILSAICEIVRRKQWTLHAAHVRSNHVHVVLTADGPPERVMNDIKTAASRRLNKVFPAEDGRRRWTRHGSTRYLWTENVVAEKVHYVLDGQGEPLARYPEASPSLRTERSGVSGTPALGRRNDMIFTLAYKGRSGVSPATCKPSAGPPTASARSEHWSSGIEC